MKKTVNNMLMAVVAILALTLSSCAKSDNSTSVSPIMGQWQSTGEEGWIYNEDGEDVEMHYLIEDGWAYTWYYDETGHQTDSEEEEIVYEPGLLNIGANGTLTISNSEYEETYDYVLKGNQIVLPEWGDELIWHYSLENQVLAIEEVAYYKGVMSTRIITTYQRK